MQKIKLEGMKSLENVTSFASSNVARNLSTIGFTVAKSEGEEGRTQKADFALVYVETNDVRIGSGSPTDSLGPKVIAGDSFVLESEEEIANTKIISAVAGVHATLHAQIGYHS